ARRFGRGNSGRVSHVAQLDGVVLAVPERESDGALARRLEHVVERGHRSIVEIRRRGPDSFEPPRDVSLGRDPGDLVLGKVEPAPVLGWPRLGGGMILDLLRYPLQLVCESLPILERHCEVLGAKGIRSNYLQAIGDRTVLVLLAPLVPVVALCAM